MGGALGEEGRQGPDFPKKSQKNRKKREDYPKIPVEIKRPAELIFEEVKLVDENGSNRLNKGRCGIQIRTKSSC